MQCISEEMARAGTVPVFRAAEETRGLARLFSVPEFPDERDVTPDSTTTLRKPSAACSGADGRSSAE